MTIPRPRRTTADPAGADSAQGRLVDVALEWRDQASLGEGLRMANGKTSALPAISRQFGAHAAGAVPPVGGRYPDFRLVDDLLGIWGDPEATGKPVGADIAVLKKSLPVVASLTSGSAARPTDLYVREEALGQDDLIFAAELIEAAEGRSRARAKADRQLEPALDVLPTASPSPAVELRTLADHLTRQDRR